jgi:hypothetical protein
MSKDSGEIYREKNYSIWRTRYGSTYYVYKDGENFYLLETDKYEEAIRFIKEKLAL